MDKLCRRPSSAKATEGRLSHSENLVERLTANPVPFSGADSCQERWKNYDPPFNDLFSLSRELLAVFPSRNSLNLLVVCQEVSLLEATSRLAIPKRSANSMRMPGMRPGLNQLKQRNDYERNSPCQNIPEGGSGKNEAGTGHP